MAPSRARFSILCLLTAGLIFSSIASQAQHCGKERWSVKTGTDSDAANVNLSSPQNTTIAHLRSLSPPNPIPPDHRFAPTETTVFVVNATLTDFKLEGGSTGDSDYHLVLQDENGATMVAEIPSPGCVGEGSPFAAQIATARAAFDGQFTATTSFQTANIPVQITGVGFFDFAHGQRGAAPNVIELHPVLNIVFNPSTPTPDFSLSLSPSTISMVQGGSTSATIQTTTTGSASPTVTVSGVPAGVSAHVTPAGSGKSMLSLTASSTAATGSFPLTVTGTAQGKSRSQTAQLQLGQVAPAPAGQQWEYRMISANSDQDLIDQANALGSDDWDLISVVRITGSSPWKAFFKRPKDNF